MWDDTFEISDFFRGGYLFLIIFPLLMLTFPVNGVNGSHEFLVHRMQHFDIHSVPFGSRSAPINLEARSLHSWKTSRHCIVARLEEITEAQFEDIAAKAGALILMLPRDMDRLTQERRLQIMRKEEQIFREAVNIPVYFIKYSNEFNQVIEDLSYGSSDSKSSTAFETLVTSISGNGYQISINSGTAAVKPDMKVITIQGKLQGATFDGKSPTIVLVAHYDSFSVAPELSFGANSNASGVAVLLEIARIFSHLYASIKSQAKYNLVFLLTGGGKINYQGSKKWIDDQLDALDSSLAQEVAFIACLDSLAANRSLYMHVSKPPKEKTPVSTYFKELKGIASDFHQMSVEGVHKKINLADENLAWEHERYSIKRLPAFTLSTIKAHKNNSLTSILDTRDYINVNTLTDVASVILEGLCRIIYNSTQSSAHPKIDKDALIATLKILNAHPRSPQMLTREDSFIVHTLKSFLKKYTNNNVKTVVLTPDKRDPDFAFYGITGGSVNIYNVKPAVFDLVLTFAIVAYLGGVYVAIQVFPKLFAVFLSLSHTKSQ